MIQTYDDHLLIFKLAPNNCIILKGAVLYLITYLNYILQSSQTKISIEYCSQNNENDMPKEYPTLSLVNSLTCLTVRVTQRNEVRTKLNILPFLNGIHSNIRII